MFPRRLPRLVAVAPLLAAITTVLIATPAGASTSTAGAGSGINLELAPYNLQQCFGSTGFLYVDGSGPIHVNGTGNGRAHYSGNLTVRAWVGNSYDQANLSGTTTVSWDAWVTVDPLTGAHILTPANINLVSPDGTQVIHGTFNFDEFVLPFDGASTQYNYGFGMLGLWSYSDYGCT
jgi:hypothetical protein